eukprot:m.20307 g.20307  ORF g.20307 m.20307 type:complete len:542 (-) comp8852_c0_seq1:511-2136(-)
MRFPRPSRAVQTTLLVISTVVACFFLGRFSCHLQQDAATYPLHVDLLMRSQRPDSLALALDSSEAMQQHYVHDPDNLPALGRIRAANTRMCLDSPSPGKLAFWPCHDSENSAQVWIWRGDRSIVNAVDSRCLSIEAGKPPDNTLHPVLVKCNKTDARQQWTYQLHGQLAGSIQNKPTGLCLTAGLKDKPPFSADDIHSHSQLLVSSCAEKRCAHLFDVHALTPDLPQFNKDAFSLPPDHKRYMSTAVVEVAPDAQRAFAAPSRKPEDASILCWVMAHPEKLNSKAVAVQNTWGRLCDKLLFMVSENHAEVAPQFASLPLVELPLGRPESRDTLWQKSKLAWKYVIDHYGDKYDWFLRTDDDTFVVFENLWSFVKPLDTKTPQYYGRVYKSKTVDFYSGGGGTLLNKAALDLLANAYTQHPDFFHDGDTFADDLEICATLKRMGLSTITSRDEQGRHVFLALGLEEERGVTRARDGNHWIFVYDPEFKEGVNCCSKHWMVTHYIDSRSMYFMNDLVSLGCEAGGSDPWWSSAKAIPRFKPRG